MAWPFSPMMTFVANSPPAYDDVFGNNVQTEINRLENLVNPKIPSLGYPAGRRCEFRENWVAYGSVTGASTAILPNNPAWTLLQTANATSGALAPNVFTNPNFQVTYGAGSNGNYGGVGTTNALLYLVASMSVVFEWEMQLTGAGANNLTVLVGLAKANTPLTSSTDVIAIGKRSADTTWVTVTNGNVGVLFTDTTIAAVASTTVRCRIELHGASSAYGYTTRFFINDTLTNTIATNIPRVNQNLGFVIDAECTGAVVETLNVGPVYGTWNRTIV